jgi:hypothetical protein
MDGRIASRVPFDVYRDIEALNMSRLKEIERSPQRFVWRATHPLITKPLTLGKAAHCAVLEPERFDQDFIIWDKLTKNGSGNIAPRSGEQWMKFNADNPGKSIITVEERDFAMAMQAAVRADPVAMKYLEVGDPEVTMEWDLSESWGLATRRCKARADWLTRLDGERYVIGIKTSVDCREHAFGAAAARYGYALQWAWYHDGYRTITDIAPRMKEIVVESAPPHEVMVYNVTEDILLEGRDRYLELLKILGECEISGKWPGPGGDIEHDLTLPTWYYGQQDDLNELGLEAA